jgi:hypothetical protein
MSILKGDRHEVSRMPYDEAGHFVSKQCPIEGCDGKLVYEGNGSWACDGLVDPNDENKELEACLYAHFDGENDGPLPTL